MKGLKIRRFRNGRATSGNCSTPSNPQAPSSCQQRLERRFVKKCSAVVHDAPMVQRKAAQRTESRGDVDEVRDADHEKIRPGAMCFLRRERNSPDRQVLGTSAHSTMSYGPFSPTSKSVQILLEDAREQAAVLRHGLLVDVDAVDRRLSSLTARMAAQPKPRSSTRVPSRGIAFRRLDQRAEDHGSPGCRPTPPAPIVTARWMSRIRWSVKSSALMQLRP